MERKENCYEETEKAIVNDLNLRYYLALRSHEEHGNPCHMLENRLSLFFCQSTFSPASRRACSSQFRPEKTRSQMPAQLALLFDCTQFLRSTG